MAQLPIGPSQSQDKVSDVDIASTESQADRISRLRFRARAKRHDPEAPENLEELESAIAAEYGALARSTVDPAQKFLCASWAASYGQKEFDLAVLGRDFTAYVMGTSDPHERLARVLDGGLLLRIDSSGRVISAVPYAELIEIAATPKTQVRSRLLLSREKAASIGLEYADWSLALHTTEGPKAPNEDAALFASYSDDSFLVAVADGTGDSNDGSRAAATALEALTDWLALTGDMRLSVEHAAAAVRAENLALHEENACTLAALYVTPDNAVLVQVSDAFHWYELEGNAPEWSRVGKEGRANIGGEPVGYTLTSSLNKVDAFRRFADTPDAAIYRELPGLQSFVLGSDGLVPDAGAGAECPIVVDHNRHNRNPFGLAADIGEAALTTMRVRNEREQRRGDNITTIVGYRRR